MALNNTYGKIAIGFDRTTGKPIYGQARDIFDRGGSKDWLAQETARYEKERVKSEQSQTQFTGIKDQEVFAALKQQILGMSSSNASRETINPDITKLLSDYSKQNAFTDAAGLMSANLAKAMEEQKPAIQRAMEGAGTSAGSMQALLSQQLADKASLSASSLGAEQAKAYGQISANLMQTQVKDMSQSNQYATDLARLADALKVSESSSTAKSYFSAEEMNPKDGTGGKYGVPGRSTYGLARTTGGTYY